MRFEEVLPALREGKKITNEHIKRCGYQYIYYRDWTIFENNGGYWHLTDGDIVEIDDWEIVEEKEKVKLRDLTKEQYKNWYKGYCYLYEDCEHCCFKAVQCDYTYERCWINHKDVYSDKFLDQEIEVEE